MSLPRVLIHAAAGEAPTVTVDDVELPGVVSAQLQVAADGVPRVALVLSASAVESELPAGVSIVQRGPSASLFVQTLSPKRLEDDALAHDDLTMGESFIAAAMSQAAEFDARG